MKTVSKYLSVLFVLLLVVTACSTQKNTKFSRFHHQLNTRYNVYFNGKNAYDEGLKKMEEANQDDYSQVLPMYVVSNHENIQAASSQMTTSIEKCRKSIKLHSIKKKPKYNGNKMSDPKYKAWYNQEEFNNQLYRAWLLLAQSEFHKGDFLESVSTFNYIIRHYSYDRDVVAQCQLWSARAYAEMGWLYEAEQVVQQVKQDELGRRSSSLYAQTMADLLLKQKLYREAIPFLQLAIDNQSSKRTRGRWWFIMGQLQEMAGNRQAAATAYQHAGKSGQTVELEFNAQVNRARMSGTDSDIRRLQKMSKQQKHKDHIDRVLGTMGDIYLNRHDTVKALECYQTAIDTMKSSTSKSKGALLVRAADLYYERQQYASAQPCYAEAISVVSSESDDYARISKRAESLGKLVGEQEKVVLQDSLQRLARLPEEQQLSIIRKMIKDKARAAEQAAEQARLDSIREADGGNTLTSVDRSRMIGGNGQAAEWYFYNTGLKSQGKTEFARRWGGRRLEDYWRYATKPTANPVMSNEEQEPADTTSLLNQQAQDSVISDTEDPRYYLQQLPTTPKRLAESNQEIASALRNMGYIYQDEVGDTVMAMRTFDELERRYPQDSSLMDVYYTRYLTYLHMGDSVQAERWRTALVDKYPETPMAQMLKTPDYAVRMRRMLMEQDSLYEQTYQSYCAAQYRQVFDNVQKAEVQYPLSPLMPKFLFLNALSTAKTKDEMAFGDALRDMIYRYPQDELSAMAKDMLAMMNQGLETQQGSSHGALVDALQDINADTTQNVTFEAEKNTPFVLLLMMPQDAKRLHALLYQVALYNFSQFLIKDFDLQAIQNYDMGRSALRISGFSSYKEAVWYEDKLKSDYELKTMMEQENVQIIKISEINEQQLKQSSLEAYKNWWEDHH